ncbi:ATP-binding protein [Actinomadura fibrosa]|uniref:ATP-binding protein n=1 Tax=Actinomadura fibrosa TaxID=111802 RepID=A0ABW2Y0D3_9ACTN|nr:AAA family ATPase [Actinomadura fibrosa]
MSSFVGRRHELAEIGRSLENARLLTVTGVGGVGKTRTALRAADRARDRFPDGVWLTELSGLEDGGLVCHVVAQALGLQDQTARPAVDVLVDYLAARRLLLVLDNCEHVLDACALLAEVLLGAAPGLRVIATSRQPLDVAGEKVLVVPPLPLPDEPERPCDSVELFVERAVAADAGFALGAGNREAVERLCRRLDGIPLAIELAAVWVPVLPVERIVERLDERFALLADDDAGTGLPRHGALRTAIGWSHELCRPAERLLWGRLSVFAGTFDADTAAAVCADDRLAAGEIPGLLDRLAEKSVLSGGPAGYRLLDTLREYGAQWLEAAGERDALQRRHLDHHLALAERCEAAWCGPDQVEWWGRMQRAHPDLRAALEAGLAEPAGLAESRLRDAGLRLAGGLYYFWVPAGLISEGRHYLDRALDGPDGPASVKALWACARIAATQGDLVAAEALTERYRARVGDGDVLAAGHIGYLTGAIAMLRGDHRRALDLLEESAELHRRGGDEGTGLMFVLLVHGMVHSMRGEFDRSVKVLEECQGLCDRHGERWVRSFVDCMLGLAELGRGDVAAAVRHGRESLRFKTVLSDSLGLALALDVLAAAAAAGGDGVRGARLLGFAEHVWRTFGLPQFGSPDFAARRVRCERTARAMLGDAAYEAALREGRELAIDHGIDYALGTADPPPPSRPPLPPP